MLGLALDDGGLGGAERRGAALRGDGLSYEVGARLRGRRLRQRRAEHERSGGYKNTPHDFLPIVRLQTSLVCARPFPTGVSDAKRVGLFGFNRHSTYLAAELA